MLRGCFIALCLLNNVACVQTNGKQVPKKSGVVLADPCNDSTYSELLARIEHQKKAFRRMYQKSANKQKTLDSCRDYLETCMADSLFDYWESTKWNFYGTTQKPQCGDIACGYFVTTLLRDLGFDVPRVRWAEVASEVFIKEFCNRKVFHLIGKDVGDVVDYLNKQNGHYFLVGLDTHVGIIEKRNGEINFLHSAYFHDIDGVAREAANGYNPFSQSRYKVFGRLFSDLQVTNWIMDVKYP